MEACAYISTAAAAAVDWATNGRNGCAAGGAHSHFAQVWLKPPTSQRTPGLGGAVIQTLLRILP